MSARLVKREFDWLAEALGPPCAPRNPGEFTAREAGPHWGVSLETVYRRLRNGYGGMAYQSRYSIVGGKKCQLWHVVTKGKR